MRLRDNIICVVCIVAAVALLAGASARLDSIHSSRQQMGLVSNAPLENAPPSLAFATVAMGAFRGLVVDILWMRADKLKEQGLFFDAKQLAEWITTLQPRFSGVWDFQAWNMAYNISVAMPASQWYERWKWVRNGYELLRDRGIEQNPHSIVLYRALAWIFQHKIADISDDCHKHYKRQLALEMRPLLGPQTREYFLAMIDAPKKLSEIEKEPAVAKFIAELKSADEAFEDDKAFVRNYLALRQMPKQFAPAAFETIDRFRTDEALKKFDVFARACFLRDVWKLEPEFMHKLNEQYGPLNPDDPNEHMPLNWEHPDPHAIYWAKLGLERARTKSQKGEYSVDEKNTDRLVFHSLQNLYRAGKLIIYPVPGELPSVFLRPDLQMFDSCNEACKYNIAKYKAIEGSNPKTLMAGHRNMLKNAVLLFYQAGRIKKAGQIYTELRELYAPQDAKVDITTFIRKRMAEEIERFDLDDATETIMMLLREAFFRYAVHDDDEAFGREKWAKDFYNIYEDMFGLEGSERTTLPSFEMLRYMAFLGFMNDEFYPEYLRRSLLGRIKIERPELFDKLIKLGEGLIKEDEKLNTETPQF